LSRKRTKFGDKAGPQPMAVGMESNYVTGNAASAAAVNHLPPADVSTDVLGRRLGAAIIDALIVGVFMGVVGALMHTFHTRTVDVGGVQSAQIVWSLGPGKLLVFMALWLLYYFTTETMTGQTLGKRLFGLQVVTLDGRGPSTGAIFVRNLSRLVDSVPFYLIGIIFMLSSRPRQRLGDRFAGTTVAPV
jgi:uncharacterized RDD family membrane protein YckC